MSFSDAATHPYREMALHGLSPKDHVIQSPVVA